MVSPQAPTGASPQPSHIELRSIYGRAMSNLLESLPPHDLSNLKAFADQEDTPSDLAMLVLTVVQAKENRANQKAKEEREVSYGMQRSLTSVDAHGVRRGATRSFYIVDSLLKLGERMDADKAIARSGFKENEDFYSFNISIVKALGQTTKNIIAMLLVAAVLSLIASASVYLLQGFLNGVTIEDASNLQFGDNSTIKDYGRDIFNDVYSDTRDRRTKQFLSMVCAFSWACMNLFGLFAFEKNVPLVYYSLFFLIMAVPAFLPTVFYACGGTNLGSGTMVVIMVVFIGVCNSIIPDLLGYGIEALIPSAVKAARDKDAIERGEVVKVKTKKTKKQRLKTAVITALPNLFTCAMI